MRRNPLIFLNVMKIRGFVCLGKVYITFLRLCTNIDTEFITFNKIERNLLLFGNIDDLLVGTLWDRFLDNNQKFMGNEYNVNFKHRFDMKVKRFAGFEGNDTYFVNVDKFKGNRFNC